MALDYKNGWGDGQQLGPLIKGKGLQGNSFVYDKPQFDPYDCYTYRDENYCDATDKFQGTIQDYWDGQAWAINYPILNPVQSETDPDTYRSKNSIEICELAIRGKLWLEPEHVEATEEFGFLPIFDARIRFIVAMAIDPVDLNSIGADPLGPHGYDIVSQYFGVGLGATSVTTSTPPVPSKTFLKNPVNEFKWPDTKPFDPLRFEVDEVPERRIRFKTLYDSIVELKNGAPNTGLDLIAESPGAVYPGDMKHIDYTAQSTIKVQFEPNDIDTFQCPTRYGQLFIILCSDWNGGAQTDGTLSWPNPDDPDNPFNAQWISELRPRFDIHWTYKWRELTYGQGTCGASLCYTHIKPEQSTSFESKEKTPPTEQMMESDFGIIIVGDDITSTTVTDDNNPLIEIGTAKNIMIAASSDGGGAQIYDLRDDAINHQKEIKKQRYARNRKNAKRQKELISKANEELELERALSEGWVHDRKRISTDERSDAVAEEANDKPKERRSKDKRLRNAWTPNTKRTRED